MRQRRTTADALAAGLIALLALGDVAGGRIGLLYLAPAILIGALLLGGLYPGAQRLARPLARARAAARRPASRSAPPRPARRIHPRGGLLLGARLAGRGPPAPTSAPLS